MAQDMIIKCPYCSVQLKIKKYPDNPDKAFITCPTCKHRSPFREFASIEIDERQYYPAGDDSNEDMTQVGIRRPVSHPNSDETMVNLSRQRRGVIGSLVLPNEEVAQLHAGVNTIGRCAPNSQSEIQFPDFDNTKMSSRHHARIEVVAQANGRYMHILSNWQNTNPTFVNDIQLQPDATAVLRDGDIIKCADVELRFSLKENEDKTE